MRGRPLTLPHRIEQETRTIRTQVVERFAGAFTAWDFADAVGPSLNCGEVDALAGLLSAIGHTEAAERWITAHAMAATEGDCQHGPAAAEEYVVPIDPMDDLQCDSCQ